MQAPQTITIDGVQHEVSSFSEGVQALVGIFAKWQGDLRDQRLEVAKTEAALRSLDVELTQAALADLKAKEAGTGEVTEVTEVV